jgi:hypothetical protein
LNVRMLFTSIPSASMAVVGSRLIAATRTGHSGPVSVHPPPPRRFTKQQSDPPPARPQA